MPATARRTTIAMSVPALCQINFKSIAPGFDVEKTLCTKTAFRAEGAGCAGTLVPWIGVLAATAATMLTKVRQFIRYLVGRVEFDKLESAYENAGNYGQFRNLVVDRSVIAFSPEPFAHLYILK
jgi:hypothetical protein